MRWLLLLLVVPLMAFTPIYDVHDKPYKVDQEFDNIDDSLQARQFTVVTTTPNIIDMQEGEIFIYASTSSVADTFLMLRTGATVYQSVNFKVIKGR